MRLAGLLAVFLLPIPGAAHGSACDRACLTGIMDAYLAAMVARTPAAAPMAASFRTTEDGHESALGGGVWGGATALGAYRIDFADPQSGNVGLIADLRTGESGVTIALRLHVADRHITEVETIVGQARVPGTRVVDMPRASLSRAVPLGQRLSRAEMIATANANFDAILAAQGRLYAPDCQRVENRMAMSSNPDLDYPIGTIPGKPKPHFGSMGCGAQIEAHLFDQLDSVGPRRFLLLDEERQLVFGVYMMRWYGKGRCNQIPGYGELCPASPRAPVALLNGELLGVRGGRVHEIEAVFTFAPYASDSGWRTDLRGDVPPAEPAG